MVFNPSVLNIKQMSTVTPQRAPQSFCSTSVYNSQGRWANSCQALSRNASGIDPEVNPKAHGQDTVVHPQTPVIYGSGTSWAGDNIFIFNSPQWTFLPWMCSVIFKPVYIFYTKCPTEVSQLAITLHEEIHPCFALNLPLASLFDAH